MKVLELKGYKSLRAFNAFHTLMLGVKMLPAYAEEDYQEFFDRVQAMPEEDQKKIIEAGVKFVPLEKEEIESLLCFCADSNGVPFCAEHLKGLGPEKIVEIIVSVCCEISKIKIDFVSDNEKKN